MSPLPPGERPPRHVVDTARKEIAPELAMESAEQLAAANRERMASFLIRWIESRRPDPMNPEVAKIIKSGAELGALKSFLYGELLSLGHLARSLIGINENEWERARDRVEREDENSGP